MSRMVQSRLRQAEKAYFAMFGLVAPLPAFVNEEEVACVLEEAVSRRRPVPNSLDWYWWLPPDAVA